MGRYLVQNICRNFAGYRIETETFDSWEEIEEYVCKVGAVREEGVKEVIKKCLEKVKGEVKDVGTGAWETHDVAWICDHCIVVTDLRHAKIQF